MEAEKKPDNQYAIPAVNFAALQQQVAKLNKIAAKLECAPVEVKILGKRTVERRVTQPDGSETQQIREYIDVEVNGTAPKLAGWEFTGRIEVQQVEGGEPATFMYPAPGKEIPKVFRDAPHVCDHCQTKRWRRNTYIVNKTETGESKRVGSDCIKDFLGHKDPGAIANLLECIRELVDELERDGGYGGGGGWSDPMYKLDVLIPQLAAIVRIKGWVTKGQVEKMRDAYGYSKLVPTVSVLQEILNPYNVQPFGRNATEERARLAALREECKPTSADAEAIEPVKAMIGTKNDGTDFWFNLSQLVKLNAAPVKQWALLTAAVGLWFKEQGLLAERKRIRNEYVPGVNPGDRVEMTLTLTGVNVFEGNFGNTTLHRFRDPDNRVVIWFSSKGKICDEGKTVKVKGTVKKLEQYKDLKQTVLTRVKEIAA